MKQIDAINAYKELESLSNIKEFHAKEQWALYELRKELRSYVDFYEEQTKAIVQKYQEYIDENGIIKGQPYIDYMNDRKDLDEMEIKDIKKIELPIVDGITFLTIESLDKFVNFQAP